MRTLFTRTTRALACALVCVALTPSAAHAIGIDPGKATPVQREQAQSRFLKGRELFSQGRFERALEEFDASHEIVASPNARLFAARCLRELGRLVAAYSEFGRTAVEAREQTRDDARYARTAESADEERRAIAPKLGFVTVTVANAKDATVLKVSGEEIRRTGWSEPIPISPGSSEVALETPGREPIHQPIQIGAGETKAMSFDADSAPLAGAPAAVVAPPPPPPPVEHGGSRPILRTASYAAGGVAVVGMATFAIFGALSNAKYGDLKTACNNGPCPPSRQSDIDAGRRDQTIANVGLAVGLIALAAGVTLFIVSMPKKTAPATAGLVLSPDGSGLGAFF